MPAKFRFGIVAMCDAAYKDERTNKSILAGVYSGDVASEQFPFELPVAFYVEITPTVGGSHSIELRFYIDGKHQMGGMVELRETIAGIPTTLIMPTMSISLERPCTLEVKFCAEGSRAVSILKKRITRPVLKPNASPLPAARSRRDVRVKASKP